MNETLKSWMMTLLTLVFVALYAAALLGLLKFTNDITLVLRLEPIIFVIIGYYFGRLPAQSNEKFLKDEINRNSQKAEAAQHLREKVQLECEVLEEKVKNTATVLNAAAKTAVEPSFKSGEHAHDSHDSHAHSSISAAIRILNS